MTEHTPTPWQMFSPAIAENSVPIHGPKSQWIADADDQADAEHIVRCVNAHDELVAAIELAIAFHSADTEAFVNKYGHGVGTREMCDRLRTALAHARGES